MEADMLALTFDGQVKLQDDYPQPRTRTGEALLAVRLAGVCGTDLEIARGCMGFRGVMGHEFVATVIEGPGNWPGKRVVAEINCVCSKCDMCRAGLSNHCRNRSVLGIDGRDGAFAEYLTVPAANLHEVSGAISDEQAVFVEPLAAAFQVMRQVKFDSAQEVVILGDGRLGQLIARVLKDEVGPLVMVGRHPAKLEAAEKVGVQTVLAQDFVAAQRADVVIDATGSASGFDLAQRTVRPRGDIVLKSTFAAKDGMNLTALVINEITLIGSRCGQFAQALRALEIGQIDISALISRRFALREAPSALAAAAEPPNIKVLIDAAR